MRLVGAVGQRLLPLRTEFVVIDLNGRAAGFKAYDAPACHQLQRTGVVELRGPADSQLDGAAGQQDVLGREEDAGTGDVQRASAALLLVPLFVENAVANFPLNWKPA